MRRMSSPRGVMTVACYLEGEDVQRQRRQVSQGEPVNRRRQVVVGIATQESLSLGFALLKGPHACLRSGWRSSPQQPSEVPTLRSAKWERIVRKNGSRGERKQRDVSQDHGDLWARSLESCLEVLSRASRNNLRTPRAHMSDTSTTERRGTSSKCLAHSVGSVSKQRERGSLPHVARTSTSRGRQTVSLCSKCLISL